MHIDAHSRNTLKYIESCVFFFSLGGWTHSANSIEDCAWRCLRQPGCTALKVTGDRPGAENATDLFGIAVRRLF